MRFCILTEWVKISRLLNRVRGVLPHSVAVGEARAREAAVTEDDKNDGARRWHGVRSGALEKSDAGYIHTPREFRDRRHR